ncbi:MAG: hypothetical protein IJ232_03985 [Lachnospiraceae bacterium]|nr:hypothetical protein [Lachnospiraceae bacterium]
MNPMALMQLKGLYNKFEANHPKVPMFFKAAGGSIGEGSIIEISVTDPAGKKMTTNMRVTEQDLELFQQLKSALN